MGPFLCCMLLIQGIYIIVISMIATLLVEVSTLSYNSSCRRDPCCTNIVSAGPPPVSRCLLEPLLNPDTSPSPAYRSRRVSGSLSLFHIFTASSQVSVDSPHRSLITAQVRCRTMLSTPLSCRTSDASLSVRASRGKNRPEYGSRRSSTTLSRSFWLSNSLNVRLGSSGSGLAATRAQ